ncbi:MAG: UdgX family uracil-DNA binding protein [Rhizobiales bacterium]|nr:UdgX family uracil-DNA binding protein [Hyphomicrobiales bacterium]
MHTIVLDSETDFDGWRAAARTLAQNGVPPQDIVWTVAGRAPELFAPTELPSCENAPAFTVQAAFIEIARMAILHRDPERFALLYRLLWRLRADPVIMNNPVDADVIRARTLAREVRRDEHKMHAFVRFREFGSGDATRFVAWFEPTHHIVELATPFFARRFASMAWSILTPERCAHWDGHALTFTAGATRADAPSDDPLEETWRTYYASIFNPARLKVKAMRTEMPKKYWRNLPEASMIDPLIAAAARTTQVMIAREAPAPRLARQRKDAPMTAPALHKPDSLAALRAEAAHCRACPLWKDATQTVFGEGPEHASLMLVGEQPGDKEDLAGKPFVGPAGMMLDRALVDAGIERNKVYVTNAVKHFKFVPRGKIRLHQKPSTPEIRACRPWYERELALIQPALVMAMGATAAQSVLGKITPIGKNRGRVIDLDDATKALVTVHPSYLLRLPDEDARAREYAAFVKDLQLAASVLRKLKAA